jgi:GR25 family glycosyltransferase involved in LPS biosynthesis
VKSFIICLSKIESSFTSAKKVKESLDSFNMPNELFEGTYGNNALMDYNKTGRHYHSWGLKGPSRPFTQEYKDSVSGIPGEIGCFDSHYRLWQYCIKLGEPILIFEDDVLLVRPFIPVEWDDVISLAFSHKKKMAKYLHYLENSEGHPRAESYVQGSMPGLAGYAIKPHAAKILVDEYKNSYLPADNAINQHLVKIQIHSHMMGKARDKSEGNVSLIKTKIWIED